MSAQLTGLSKDQTYFFRIRASNPVGPASGAGLSFTWAPARPDLRASTVAPNQPFAFQFTGTPGHTYQVLASADLVHWSIVGTAAEVAAGEFEYADEDSQGLPARFYRVAAP